MIFGFLVLFVALFIAGIAAWFSIAGLMAIFAGASLSIAIMGSALELGKILAASWLYRHWETAPLLLKSYMTAAVVALMVITSMGIFGYLSKAHLEQTAGLGANQVQIERLETQIEREQREIARAENVLDQLDAAIDEYTELGYVTRGLEAREAQQAERATLSEIIANSETRIAELEDTRAELNTEIQALESEVGPIKYLASLIYGDTERDLIDDTVRIFILILVAVFDPLAISLLLAANYTLLRFGVNLERGEPETVDDEPQPAELTEAAQAGSNLADNPPESDPEPTATNNATVGRRA